jgi:hypothetical protein
MGLERRHGRLYYYRKIREGRRVKSEYAGAGIYGQFESMMDKKAAHERAAVKAEWDAKQAEMEAEEAGIVGYLEVVDKAVNQALERAGYHRPSRKLQWMKHLGPRSPLTSEDQS